MKNPSPTPYPSELITLARNISCNFVDVRTTTKDYVGTIAIKNSDQYKPDKGCNQFLLSTCLRYEIYDCNNTQKPIDSLFRVKGVTCIRRILSILTGLQSEIIGEREIFIQTVQAIDKSQELGNLSKETLDGLQKLISLSEQIRIDTGINSNENYSTIAADILIEHLSSTQANATVAIVGGGYMAEKFFSSLLQTKFVNIKKLFWINRSVTKVEKRITQLIDLLDIDIEVLDLEDGKYALGEADAIFCALSNSPKYYKDVSYKEAAFVVDVSYPQVFAEQENIKFISVSNTYFDRLIKNPTPRSHVAHANKEIDAVIDFLNQNL
mgnify:FL=1